MALTQGDRIKTLRKDYLHLTLEQFGDRLGVTKVTISRLENEVNNLTEQMIKSICREFHVSEEWLRTGEGEMFQALNRHEHLASLTQKILADKPDSFRNRLITVLDGLSESEWEFLEQKARELFAEQKKDPE